MAKILVIEDNLMIRENICELLELNSYHVRSTDNGHDGLSIAKEWIPDLILCDILMPEMDGYGVLHEIHAIPDLTTIPVIFLTAKSERSEQQLGLDLGAFSYLVKPFDMNVLLAGVQAGLNK